MNRWDDRLRWAGLAAVVVLWLTVIVGMQRTDLRVFDERPISFLGTTQRSVVAFRTGLCVAAVFMAGFAWLVKRRLGASTSFLVVFLVGLGGQVVAALVPIVGPGSSHAVHVAGGLVLGASLPALMWRFAAGHAPDFRRRRAYLLFWLEMAACAIGFGLSKASQAPLAEIVPAIVFHVWVAIVTVWARRPAADSDPYGRYG